MLNMLNMYQVSPNSFTKICPQYKLPLSKFLFAITLSSKEVITIPIHMAGAVDTRGVQFWFMAVRAMIAMIPPVLIALLAQRYIVQGLTLGAVKG